MANWSDPRMADAATISVGTRSAAFDAGLRSYMLSVYNYMTSGVLLTGIVALLFASSGAAQNIMFGPGLLKWVIILAPLAFILVMNFGLNRLSTFGFRQAFGVLRRRWACLCRRSFSSTRARRLRRPSLQRPRRSPG